MKGGCKCLNLTVVHFFNILILVMSNQTNSKKMISILLCYFNLWMVYPYIKTLKSSVDFANVLRGALKSNE